MSFSLSFSSSNVKVSSKRVQKVKMVLNSSVKRNVSTKNSEEVEDRERGEGRIIMQVCICQWGRCKKGRGTEGEGEREKSAITPSPFPFLLIPFPFRRLIRRLSEHKNFMG